MHLMHDAIERLCSDREVYQQLLELDGKLVIELGCGAAVNSRALAASGRARQVNCGRLHYLVRAEPQISRCADQLSCRRLIAAPRSGSILG